MNPARSGVKPVAIVAGYLVRYPLGGFILAQSHLLAGLQRLGFDPVFVEHHGWANACYDPQTNAMSDDPTTGIAVMRRTFVKFGLGRWCYVDARETFHGLSRPEVAALCREAAVLISWGATTWLDEFRDCRTRVFLDADPGFTQFKMSPTACAGYASPLEFNHHVTFGERIGKPDCPIPTHGLNWRPTRPPVALDLVQPRYTPDARFFTTVMSWTAYGNVEYQGKTYGQKDVELLKVLDLPRRAGRQFELALAGPDAPTDRLRTAGWEVTAALPATIDVEAYLDYIGRSRGEFAVAKDAYVTTRSGWFSDRTANYLAMGKPAVVQDTGFSESLPCGEGLFAFKDADDIAVAVETINRDYKRHCLAARRVAEEYFGSDRVIGKLLRDCGLSPS